MPKQWYIFRAVLAPFADVFLFPTSDDRETFRRSASKHISSLSGCLSTILAKACGHMSQVETYRICVSSGSTSSTVLYARNGCTEDSRLLASPAYLRGVRGISGARSPCSRGRGQYHGCAQAV